MLLDLQLGIIALKSIPLGKVVRIPFKTLFHNFIGREIHSPARPLIRYRVATCFSLSFPNSLLQHGCMQNHPCDPRLVRPELFKAISAVLNFEVFAFSY